MWAAAEGAGVPSREEMRRARVQRHGAQLQDRLDKATVAICGLGGLGSNIAVLLARAGVGRLILIDFDGVDVTNLHRQQYQAGQTGVPKAEALAENLRAIDPYIRLELHAERITRDNYARLLSGADIICEAFDRAEEKAMLVNGVLEKLPDKYIVAGSGMAGLGSANAIRTRRIGEKFYLCGDGVSDVADDIGLVASRVAICAAHQAHMVLRIIARQYEI